MVRAKFKCRANEGGQIGLEPVHSGSEENKEFFQATPSGVISMGIVNESAAAAFVPGAEHYVDFTPAPAGS